METMNALAVSPESSGMSQQPRCIAVQWNHVFECLLPIPQLFHYERSDHPGFLVSRDHANK
jgi:hypothetical protein